MLHILTLIVALVWASAGSAQGLFSMQSRQDGRAWEAVGRLEVGETAFCTGALIAPDQVLTAAHCLFDATTGERLGADDMQFLAGWRNGRAAAYRRVRRAVAHPEYVFDSEGTGKVRHDLALIELQHPINNTTIKPFETDRKPAQGDDVGVVSYAHNRSEAPALQELCGVLARQEGLLILSCKVDFGSSGSPVFSFATGDPRIVSVVSAKAEANGEPVSLATWLEGPLDELRAALETDIGLDEGLVRTAAGVRRDTGAKFIRP